MATSLGRPLIGQKHLDCDRVLETHLSKLFDGAHGWSYREHLTLGFTADPTVVPDLWEATEDLRASYEELRVAAGVRRGSEKRTA